ncbi:Methylenetetrahydrofolate reductase, partial [Globisporangium splendens]
MKIIDKINQCIEKNEVFYSFEFFPPKTPAGVDNLYTRMDRMASLEPLFCDMTWGAGGSSAQLTIDISANAQKLSGLEMLMHMTCTNMTEEDVKNALEKAKDAGITNILALRGDPVRGAVSFNECDRGFSHAVDLVRYIKKHYGDHFSIGVAGYPERHAESADSATDIKYFKEKIDAGADFVITQLFYDVNVYVKFVEDCRKAGITCPIIPGIMPIQNYGGFVRMTSFCNTYVPEEITAALKPIKDNDEAVKDYGVELGIEMCKQLMAAGAPGLHFYTLNLERSVRRILDGLSITSSNASRRELPWRPSTLSKRSSETVRPIYWSNRPKSYIQRTALWDEYPNGRWGNSESPAFGDLSESHYFSTNISPQNRKAMWGEAPVSKDDIHQTFVKYVRGEISSLPWCDSPLHLETKTIQDKLAAINTAGFLTVNSQPRVNGARSDDPLFGWGGPGGRVYQKAYVECFVSPENMKKIIEAASTKRYIQYHAVDFRGHSYSNAGKSAIAVTWGVFPNKEILQPTIVDSNSFMAWKDEAFALWLSLWASLYDDESAASEVIHEIHDTYFLVSIVDNDFIGGDIWSIFDAQPSPNAAP